MRNQAQRDEDIAVATQLAPHWRTVQCCLLTASSVSFRGLHTLLCVISFEPEDVAPGLFPGLFLIHTSGEDLSKSLMPTVV